MNTFALKIVTPDGPSYDGAAQSLTVRTTTGDMGILAGHINCVAPLGMGQATVITDRGEKRIGACIGGMVSTIDGVVTVVATTFEWAEDIDRARAEASADRAKKVLEDKTADNLALRLAEARLKRAVVRSSVSQTYQK